MTRHPARVTNIVIAGLGGQGVLKASDIIADTAFRAGLDVKKSEIHGMSQRGGSVTSDVRFGPEVFSPMVPAGEADYLVVLDPAQLEPNRHMLGPHSIVIMPDRVDPAKLINSKTINTALIGVLSGYLDFAEELWLAALRAQLAGTLQAANLSAFHLGRSTVPSKQESNR
jgi:indolepyruvate ferredoxin oxidoreductase beta subunit